jgi:putative endonuclease
MPATPPRPWVLYVLRCGDGTLYCGITNDLPRRFAQHQCGKGARYTRGRGPLLLLKSWPAVSHSAALKAERAFKKLSREAKDRKLRSRARKDDVSRLLRGE